MESNNLGSTIKMYLADIYDNTYIMEDREILDFIFHDFCKLRTTNSSIPVIDKYGGNKYILASSITKIYFINDVTINIRIFKNS